MLLQCGLVMLPRTGAALSTALQSLLRQVRHQPLLAWMPPPIACHPKSTRQSCTAMRPRWTPKALRAISNHLVSSLCKFIQAHLEPFRSIPSGEVTQPTEKMFVSAVVEPSEPFSWRGRASSSTVASQSSCSMLTSTASLPSDRTIAIACTKCRCQLIHDMQLHQFHHAYIPACVGRAGNM